MHKIKCKIKHDSDFLANIHLCHIGIVLFSTIISSCNENANDNYDTVNGVF